MTALAEVRLDATAAPPARVVVFLGTDHHPFARLVQWVDRWAAAHPASPCFIHHGPAPAPEHTESSPYVDVHELAATLASADVIVVHAGPGTIMDALEAGHLPIVVPRLARFGEVVDDHQVAFGRLMQEQKRAVYADHEQALFDAIDRALARPEVVEAPSAEQARATATLIGDLIDGLLST